MKALQALVTTILLVSATALANAPEQPEERIYLHTDKQVYLSGEQLRLKLYLTDSQGRPQSLSKIAYIELLDADGPRLQQKIEIDNATAHSVLTLPTGLTTGYYSLVAYTRYMRNEGEEAYFRKHIAIVNTLRTDRSLRSDTALPDKPPVPLRSEGLTIRTDNNVYNTRSHGEIFIEELPDSIHSLSVSIAGEEFIPLPGNDITILDRQLRLPSITRHNATQPALLPEYEGHIIQARLIDAVTGEPAGDNPTVMLGFAGDGLRLSGGHREENGTLSFRTGQIRGLNKIGIAIQPGSEATEGKTYKVEIQSPFASHTPEKLPPLALNPAWGERLLERSVGVQAQNLFAVQQQPEAAPSQPYFRWKPDYAYLLDEYTRFDQMNVMFIEFIPYLRFRRAEDGRQQLSVMLADYTFGNSLALLDGIPVADHNVLYNYNPRLLKKIDIYQGRYVFAGNIFDGIASFTSITNDAPTLRNSSSMQILAYEGTQPLHPFHAPVYNEPASNKSRIPDYRHTLLWEPEAPLQSQNALRLGFTTSDLKGSYLVTVEGLTSTGLPLRAIARFSVR
jgi:hypothetical protein